MYIKEHFLRQATACDALGSPFTATLCRQLAHRLGTSTRTGARVLGWQGNPGADAVALRLCGGFHALVLTGRDAELARAYPPNVVEAETLGRSVSEAIVRNDAFLHDWMDSPPQTNETGRSAMLLPGFLTIARETGLPLALVEIGASAGLNLMFDKFHYQYGRQQWGDSASAVSLAPDTHRAPPLDGDLAVVSRKGCDIAPVYLADEAAKLRLRAFIWPDQQERRRRLDAAIGIATATPFMLERADAASFVEAALEERREQTTFVLFHSIMWQYMPAATRTEIEKTMRRAGIAARTSTPVAWLRLEPLDTGDPHATLTLTLWPNGATRHLAKCDYHGRWIEWLV